MSNKQPKNTDNSRDRAPLPRTESDVRADKAQAHLQSTTPNQRGESINDLGDVCDALHVEDKATKLMILRMLTGG